MDLSKEILSLTADPNKATRFDVNAAIEALRYARQLFPEFKLLLDTVGERMVVCTHGTKIQRYIRV